MAQRKLNEQSQGDKQLSSHTDSDSSAGVAVILTPVNQPALAFRGQTSNAVC